jgi:hypothetical protein
MSRAAVVSYESHHIVVMRLGQAGLSMESVVLSLQSVAEIFVLSPQPGFKPHTSEALAERYLNGSQAKPAYPRQLIIQTVHILQLDSAVTGSLPRGSVVRPFQPYFPIT